MMFTKHKRGFLNRVAHTALKPIKFFTKSTLMSRVKNFVAHRAYTMLALNVRKPYGILFVDNFEPSGLNAGFRFQEIQWFLTKYRRSALFRFSGITKSSSDYISYKVNQKWPINTCLWDHILHWRAAIATGGICFRKVVLQRERVSAKCAYIHFIANAFLARDYLEKNNIPFVFILFPGGGLRLNDQFSDMMLKMVFSSPMFRGCFITQSVVYDYVISKNLCPKEKLYFSYGGGFLQISEDTVLQKMRYGIDKDTIDICFVAFRYMEQGLDKGFDIALKALCQIIREFPHVHFHIVGTNRLSDFPEALYYECKRNIHEHGVLHKDELVELYAKMDIALSPNRPNVLANGAFDGAPLGVEASYCGVMLMVSNELNEKFPYIPEKDLVVVRPNVTCVVSALRRLLLSPERINEIGLNGQHKTRRVFSGGWQRKIRMAFIRKYLGVLPHD